MRKTKIYAFTAAATLAVTAAQPMTVMAATLRYNIAGNNQKQIVIGGSQGLNVRELLANGSKGNTDCNILKNGKWNINLSDLELLDSDCPDFQNHLEFLELCKELAGSGSSDKLSIPNVLEIPSFSGNLNTQETPNFPNNPSVPNQPEATLDKDTWTMQVVELVNAERAKAGLPALRVHSGAAGAADVRAKEIVSAFSHTRPDGSSFSTALKEAGVSYRASGENIAYGQESPQEVMEQWMNSAGHRANILNPDFTEIGVGHYESAGGVDYWTQLFVG